MASGKQVHDMVEMLQSQEMMKCAVSEMFANLVIIGARLRIIGDQTPLERIQTLAPLFETLAIQLCEVGNTLQDIESVAGTRVHG